MRIHPSALGNGRNWAMSGPIHHEAWNALSATEQERESGIGVFDVIEDRDGFAIYDGAAGMVVETCNTLAKANREAQRLADSFDAERKARAPSYAPPPLLY